MRPIDADKLIFQGIPVDARIMKAINNAPTVDAVPVVHGEWIEWPDPDDATYECSACGEPFILISGTPIENEYRFCPHCGAKMREGVGG